MLTIALSFLGNFFNKYKKYIIGALILIGLLWYIHYLTNRVAELKVETSRQATNIENMQFKVDTTVLANGKLKYTVNSLNIKKDELKFFSEDIYNKLAAMDIKLKNVKGVTNIDYHYTTIVNDTIKTQKINSNTYSFEVNKNNMLSNGLINIPEGYPNSSNPFVTNMKVQLNDSLIIVPENQYKRRWIFWKKLTGVKVHITSANPDFKLDRVQTLEITQ